MYLRIVRERSGGLSFRIGTGRADRADNALRKGIAIAKENGIYKGRKPIDCPELEAVVGQWKRGELTAVEAMKRLNLKPRTFYRNHNPT